MDNETSIEIEVSETLAYSRNAELFEGFCPECRSMVRLGSPSAASILMRKTERQIYRQVEAGEVHFVETDRVLVCLNSLPQGQS